tara:strand:- start:126 stop:386 length:261 start_codon:yes stop_codon:yes gene_type:complete
MEKYLKLPGNGRIIKATNVTKVLVSGGTTIDVHYRGGAKVTINHGVDPTANILKLEDAISTALASKWNEVLHTIESLPVAPTGALA